MPELDADVCIIGAGAAGLAAAAELSAQQRSVIVLEARNRLGGRMLTDFSEAHPDLPVELGAEFVHGRHPNLFHFAEQNGLHLSEMEGIVYREKDGRLQPANEEDDSGIDQILSSPELAKHDEPFQNYLLRLPLPQDKKTWITSYVEGFNGADARRISTSALLHQQQAEDYIDGESAWRLDGGYKAFTQLLAARLASSCQVHLETVAKQIVWKTGRVRIEAAQRNGSRFVVHSKALIVTAPIGVLKNRNSASALQFEPEPALLRQLDLLEMGSAVRLNLVFPEPVWESAAPHGGFLLSHEKFFPTWWPRSAPSGHLLTAWSGGPTAAALPVQSRDELLSLALQTLSRLLKTNPSHLRSKLESVHYHDWHSDPFSLGSYSYVASGGFEFSQHIAEPVEQTLWFAGEAVSPNGYWGTVHGALESGQQAAQAAARILAQSRS